MHGLASQGQAWSGVLAAAPNYAHVTRSSRWAVVRPRGRWCSVASGRARGGSWSDNRLTGQKPGLSARPTADHHTGNCQLAPGVAQKLWVCAGCPGTTRTAAYLRCLLSPSSPRCRPVGRHPRPCVCIMFASCEWVPGLCTCSNCACSACTRSTAGDCGTLQTRGPL